MILREAHWAVGMKFSYDLSDFWDEALENELTNCGITRNGDDIITWVEEYYHDDL